MIGWLIQPSSGKAPQSRQGWDSDTQASRVTHRRRPRQPIRLHQWLVSRLSRGHERRSTAGQRHQLLQAHDRTTSSFFLNVEDRRTLLATQVTLSRRWREMRERRYDYRSTIILALLGRAREWPFGMQETTKTQHKCTEQMTAKSQLTQFKTETQRHTAFRDQCFDGGTLERSSF